MTTARHDSADTSRPRAIVAWSSGKDSAFALYEARRAATIDVVGVLTTVTEGFGRIAMHGVREEVLARQVAALGLPVVRVGIPNPCPNAAYEAAMTQGLVQARELGATHVVFGDLFLADIRAYREARLAEVGMHPVFPLWGRDTGALAREMIDAGLEARIVCVDPRRLDRSFAGRRFDRAFLDALPGDVDPCGENGEFHTVVTAGPMFARPIAVTMGDVVERDGFVFADVVPAGA
ncbi:MAG TPA: ATP-binding protein [Candidatus Eisenbacteria bacterium]|nr:ATP-binding protein [Candidatus Eisenbacteria bacterium]